jgi:hypothetical protein
MGNDQPALRALFASEFGLSEPEIGLEHAFVRFVLLIWQLAIKKARQMLEFVRNQLRKNRPKMKCKSSQQEKFHY